MPPLSVKLAYKTSEVDQVKKAGFNFSISIFTDYFLDVVALGLVGLYGVKEIVLIGVGFAEDAI